MLHKSIKPLTFTAAFIQSVTEKDIVSQPAFNTYSPTEKAKFVLGNAVGRVTGWYPFAQLTGTHPYKLNLDPASYLNNKWIQIGAFAWLYSHVPGVPGRRVAKAASMAAIAGGAAGTLFDDPPPDYNSSSNSVMQSPVQRTNSVTRNNTGLSM
jgi:hypothetical protein